MIFVTTRVMAGRQLGYGGRGHSFKKHQRSGGFKLAGLLASGRHALEFFLVRPASLSSPVRACPNRKAPLVSGAVSVSLMRPGSLGTRRGVGFA
jgi:hypothetical protein